MDEQKNKRIETAIAWVGYSITLIFDRPDYSFHHHGAATDLRDVQKRLATLANCHREIAKKKPRITEASRSLCGRYLSKLRPDFALAIPSSAVLFHAALGNVQRSLET
jgi:hypothetical protein